MMVSNFQGLSKAFSSSIHNINFFFSSLKLLTNFENAYWNPPKNSLFCDWSIFCSAGLSLVAGKIINLSYAASGMILQNHRRLHVSISSVKIVALGSLKRVTAATDSNNLRIFSPEKFGGISAGYFDRFNVKISAHSVCVFLLVLKNNWPISNNCNFKGAS